MPEGKLTRATLERLRRESASFAAECRANRRKSSFIAQLAPIAGHLQKALESCLDVAELAIPKSPKDWFPQRRRAPAGPRRRKGRKR